MPDMECGFARELFLQWCSNPKNSVILTSRSSPGTLGRDLVVNGGDRYRLDWDLIAELETAGGPCDFWQLQLCTDQAVVHLDSPHGSSILRHWHNRI